MNQGFDLYKDGNPFPYAASGIYVQTEADGIRNTYLPNGAALDPSAVYTVAISQHSYTKKDGLEGNARDTGILVTDAVSALMKEMGTISPECIESWNGE